MTLDDAFALLTAVLRVWLSDAAGDDQELAALADFLGLAVDDLRQRLPMPPAARRVAGPVEPGCCAWCGQALVKPARGRMPTYCGASCRAAAWHRRLHDLE